LDDEIEKKITLTKGQIYLIWQAINKDDNMHFNCQEKEKTQTIDNRRQSNHYLSTRATPCRREYGCASSKTVND
jgi:hypothetical protein